MEKSTHTSEYAQLTALLRQTRENAGLSQRALAAGLRVPHSWVAKVETGERRIDLIEFGWFMATCGVDPTPMCSRLFETIRAKQGKRRSKGGGTR